MWEEGADGTESLLSLGLKFESAMRFVASLSASFPSAPLPFKERMKLYGLYLVVVHGACKIKDSVFLSSVLRAKREVWRKCEGFSREEAMREFVRTVQLYLPLFPDSSEKEYLCSVLYGSQIRLVVPKAGCAVGEVFPIIWLCKLGGLPFKLLENNFTSIAECPINPENPLLIDPSGPILQGTTSIIKFLSTKYPSLHSYYPQNNRPKIDEYLAWHNAEFQFFHFPDLQKSLMNSYLSNTQYPTIKQSMEILNNTFLKHTGWIAHTEQPSIADFIAFSSLLMIERFGDYLKVNSTQNLRNLHNFMDRMRNIQYFSEVEVTGRWREQLSSL